jgi:hypothetical protein
MFNQFLNTGFDKVLDTAKVSSHVVQNDYFPIYDAVEQYVQRHKLIVSSAETLIQQPRKGIREYIIYGANIFKHANNLSNEIAKITIYVLLYTNKKNEDFSIVVNGKKLIQLFNISKKYDAVINPVQIKVRGSSMLLYPPEFELINIYHQLYSPKYAQEWEKLTVWEKTIRKQLVERQKIISGGGKPYNNKKTVDNKYIFQWLKDRDDYVLVGTNAINKFLQSNEYFQKIQIITKSPIKKFVNEFDNFIFQFTGRNTFSKTHSANIQTEPRMQKTVVSVKLNSKTVHLIDIFNNAQFELIPYTTYDGFSIAYPNVLKMFIMVDIWFFRILFALNILTQSTLNRAVQTQLLKLDKVDLITLDKYDKESYMGSYNDLMRYKQKEGLNNAFYPYNPEQHRHRKGAYRTMT